MAKKRPVMIWTIRQTPRRDPKFHHDEMLDGAGRSMNEWLIILNNGCVFLTLADHYGTDCDFSSAFESQREPSARRARDRKESA